MRDEAIHPQSDTLPEENAEGFLLFDPDGRLLFADAAAESWFGPPEGGSQFSLRLHPDDRPGWDEAFAAALARPGGAPLRLLLRPAPLSGDPPRPHDGLLSASVQGMRDGAGRHWVRTALRLSGDKSAAESLIDLRAKGRLLDLLLDNLAISACRMDGDGRVLQMLGAGGREGTAGWPGRSRYLERVRRGETVHFELESGQGAARRVREIWFAPDPSDGGILALGLDVTERKRAEEELSKSEALGRRIIESSRDSIMVLDSQGILLSLSQNGRALLEMEDPDEHLGRSWLDFWRGDDRVQAEEAFRAAARNGLGKFQGYCPTLSGRPKWWDVVLTPILDSAWEPERLVAIWRDITDQKRFEESLRRSKDQMEAVLRAVTDALVVADAAGRVVYATDAAARLFGVPSAHRLLHSDLDDLARRLHAQEESGADSPWPRPFPGPHGEGRVLRLRPRGAGTGSAAGEQERWVVANTAAVHDGEGRAHLIIASAYDFTERKRAETALKQSELQLRQSQKMEAMGRLAGGVAHDFNNLLTAINGYSELLAKSLPDDHFMQDTVGEIRRAGERAASLTRQLLTFSRRQIPANRPLDLNEVVSDVRRMLGRLIGEDIQLNTVLEASPSLIFADPGQVEQLLLNLALNARDAMPTGGVLTIRTDAVLLQGGGENLLFAPAPGRYAKLTVTDTGIGMDEEVKAHLFEPFFTTKPPGQGTGLGLSTVYGIVKTAGGNLAVASEPGRGTTFTVYLPISKQEEGMNEGGIGSPDAAGTAPGGEVILLVEDEDLVRRLIAQVVVAHGYRVIEAGSGQAALDAVARHAGRIDLLLTDVVMAGMSGRELAEKLVAMLPGLKVIYMSGYTDDAVLRHGVFYQSTAFLDKPFSPGVLVEKLRDVLRSVPSPAPAPGAAN